LLLQRTFLAKPPSPDAIFNLPLSAEQPNIPKFAPQPELFWSMGKLD
jgi:hypothetical protein